MLPIQDSWNIASGRSPTGVSVVVNSLMQGSHVCVRMSQCETSLCTSVPKFFFKSVGKKFWYKCISFWQVLVFASQAGCWHAVVFFGAVCFLSVGRLPHCCVWKLKQFVDFSFHLLSQDLIDIKIAILSL